MLIPTHYCNWILLLVQFPFHPAIEFYSTQMKITIRVHSNILYIQLLFIFLLKSKRNFLTDRKKNK